MLEDIRKELVEKLIPTEETTPEEKDQIANEKELMKTLGNLFKSGV